MSSPLLRALVKKSNDLHSCWKTGNSGQCQKCERNQDNSEGYMFEDFDQEDLKLLEEMIVDYEYNQISHPKKVTAIYNGEFTLPVGAKSSDTTRQPRIVWVLDRTIGNAIISGKVVQAANILGWASTCESKDDKILIGLGFRDRGGSEAYDEAFVKQIYK